RRALKAAQDWIDVGGDPEDNDWDDDTDDDEARARERWLDAQEARQLASEKSRILIRLQDDPEVRAFVERYKGLSSNFANDPPDTRSPDYWGNDNAEALKSARDRERVRKQAIDRCRLRFCLGKIKTSRRSLPQLLELRDPLFLTLGAIRSAASGRRDWQNPK